MITSAVTTSKASGGDTGPRKASGPFGTRRRKTETVLAIAGCVAVTASWFVSDSLAGATTTHTFVTMGDSFTSGQGNTPYQVGTDTAQDKCHRSATSSYAAIVGSALRTQGWQAINVACSGAGTGSLFSPNQSERPQVAAVIGHKVDRIALTVGGNDIDATTFFTNPPSDAVLQQKLEYLQSLLVPAYLRLRNDAGPNTHIDVLGYPELFPTNASLGTCLMLPAYAQVLDGFIAQIDATIAASVKAANAKHANIVFVNDQNLFDEHQVCTATPWEFGFNIFDVDSSFHPNALGQKQLALLELAAIKNT